MPQFANDKSRAEPRLSTPAAATVAAEGGSKRLPDPQFNVRLKSWIPSDPEETTKIWSLGTTFTSQICGIRRTPLFGDDFNGTYRRVIYVGSEVELYFALWRGLNMLKGFDQRLRASFAENIKSFEEH